MQAHELEARDLLIGQGTIDAVRKGANEVIVTIAAYSHRLGRTIARKVYLRPDERVDVVRFGR